MSDHIVLDELVKGLRPAFLKSVGTQLDDMDEAIQNSDMDTLSRHCHRLKGAGSGYGFPKITNLCSELESEIQSSKGMESILGQYQKLKDHYQTISIEA